MSEKEKDVPLSGAEKRQKLFERQKALLDTFLATGAITRAQYDRSLSCLKEKMALPEQGNAPFHSLREKS